MPQSAQESGSEHIYFDADLAKDYLYALALKNRKSIAWLIKGAHNLGISYLQAFNLRMEDCTFYKEKGTYTCIIRRGVTAPVIVNIIPGVKPQTLYPMTMWWKYPSRPTSIVTLKFIRSALDVLGIALDEKTSLPVGFFEDAEALDDPIVQSQLLHK